VEAIVDWRIGYGFSANVGWAYASSRIVENEFEPASVGNQQAASHPSRYPPA
jgi:hypothetical protein